MNNPLATSVEMIRYAIGERVRDLGGDDDQVDEIATSAAYAVFIGVAADALRP
jgi:hypothetical protein